MRFYKLFSRVYLYSKHIMYNFVIYSKLRTWMAPFLENEEIKLDMLWISISFTKNLVFWVKHRFANLCIVYYQTFYYLVWLENLITDEVWRVGRIYWQREISLILRLYSYALGMQCYWPDFFHFTPIMKHLCNATVDISFDFKSMRNILRIHDCLSLSIFLLTNLI